MEDEVRIILVKVTGTLLGIHILAILAKFNVIPKFTKIDLVSAKLCSLK